MAVDACKFTSSAPGSHAVQSALVAAFALLGRLHRREFHSAWSKRDRAASRPSRYGLMNATITMSQRPLVISPIMTRRIFSRSRLLKIEVPV